MTTTELIPTNGVYITPTQYPKGYQVARYDGHGFASMPRWFDHEAAARAYASKLAKAH